MIGKILGAMAGRAIDRSDGKGGLAGTIAGALAPGVIRKMGPLGLVIGGLYVANKAMNRRKTRV